MSDMIDRDALVRFLVDDFLFGDPRKLPSDEASLLDSGIIDSTGVLELIEFLETTFGISVEDVETVPENLGSIANITRYLSRKREASI